MEHYWNAGPRAHVQVDSESTQARDDSSLASEYDRIRRSQMLAQGDEGWQAELRHYLKHFPDDVSRDTDLIKWWQVRSHTHHRGAPALIVFLGQWPYLSDNATNRPRLPPLPSIVRSL